MSYITDVSKETGAHDATVLNGIFGQGYDYYDGTYDYTLTYNPEYDRYDAYNEDLQFLMEKGYRRATPEAKTLYHWTKDWYYKIISCDMLSIDDFEASSIEDERVEGAPNDNIVRNVLYWHTDNAFNYHEGGTTYNPSYDANLKMFTLCKNGKTPTDYYAWDVTTSSFKESDSSGHIVGSKTLDLGDLLKIDLMEGSYDKEIKYFKHDVNDITKLVEHKYDDSKQEYVPAGAAGITLNTRNMIKSLLYKDEKGNIYKYGFFVDDRGTSDKDDDQTKKGFKDIMTAEVFFEGNADVPVLAPIWHIVEGAQTTLEIEHHLEWLIKS